MNMANYHRNSLTMKHLRQTNHLCAIRDFGQSANNPVHDNTMFSTTTRYNKIARLV